MKEICNECKGTGNVGLHPELWIPIICSRCKGKKDIVINKEEVEEKKGIEKETNTGGWQGGFPS